MIVSDLHLQGAAARARANIARYGAYMDDESARFLQLRARVDRADGLHLGGVLFVRTGGRVAGGGGGGGGGEGEGEGGGTVEGLAAHGEGEVEGDAEYNEVENRHVVLAAGEFIKFEYLFEYGVEYEVRAEFFVVETDVAGQSTDHDLGYLETTLAAVLAAPEERRVADLIRMDHRARVGTGAFEVDWMCTPTTEISLDVRIRVRRKGGWPFSSSRVFYTVYRLDFDGQWKPLYRSEVRVKATDAPHAAGYMLYSIAEINQLVATIGRDSGVLRIEFFQYKTNGSAHKLLGVITTSLLQLRQADARQDLGMELLTFTNKDLVGRAVLDSSRFTAARSFFSIRADFGGPVTANYLFVDFAMAFRKGFFRTGGRRSVFAATHPYYELSSCSNGKGRDEVVFRSQKGAKPSGSRFLKFPVAKINAARLEGVGEHICISVHNGDGVRVAWVRTALKELLTLPEGSVLPLKLRTASSQGSHIMLQRRELAEDSNTKGNMYLSLRCLLGEGYCMSDRSSEVSELVEIPDDFGSESTRDDNDSPQSSNPGPSVFNDTVTSQRLAATANR